MRSSLYFSILLLMACSVGVLNAQDLAPRAYFVTPVHSNAVTIAYSRSSGDLDFGSTLPITGASADVNVSTLSYYHAMDFFGRSSNFTVSMPYLAGYARGEVIGSATEVRRSGLMDLVMRFSVNIKGAPAMHVPEFIKWQQKTVVGASLKIVAPIGQYDSTKLINPGSNRWAFKPEIGVSRRWGHWVVDGYGAVWFFTKNPKFFSENPYSPTTNTQAQQPIGAVESHVSYDVKRGLWFSGDINFWYGGRTVLNELVSRPTLQANSRIGATTSIPVSKHQSMKFSYSHGARVRYGGRTDAISIAWQYSWIGKPSY